MAAARYAIYFAPDANSRLHRFGSQLLGYDAASGAGVPFPEDVTRLVPDWPALSEDPRRYGFHATLKAPFFLASDRTERDLVRACGRFAASPRAIPIIEPVVRSISGFIAIIPSSPSTELATLAADCVRDFDDFRAPLTEADRARRNPDSLTARQLRHLDEWGYPYVFEDFRFHMTLTGRVAEDRRAGLVDLLQQRFDRIHCAELKIDGIALFRQSDPGARFMILDRWPLHS